MHQGIGVLGISSKTFQSICNHFAQGTYILVLRRKNAHLIRICLRVKLVLISVPDSRFRKTCRVDKFRTQLLFDCKRFLDACDDGITVEVGVCDRREKIDCHKMIDIFANLFSFLAQHCGDTGEPFGHIDQKIQHSG